MQSIAEEKDHALSGRYLALLEVSSSNAVTANVRFLKFLMQNILLTIHHVLGSAKSAHARFQWDALNWMIRATQSNPIPYLDASLRGASFSRYGFREAENVPRTAASLREQSNDRQ
jgi:hypothetical protein